MQYQATRFAHDNARRLRNAQTDAEQRLWFRLRRHQLGVRFRRQHPFGSFIADFACLDPKIVIEVDGSQHAKQIARDAMRTAFFERHGFTMLRFNANDVMASTDAVIAVIFETIGRRQES